MGVLDSFRRPAKTRTLEELQGYIPIETGPTRGGRKTASVTRFTKRTPYRTLLNLYRNDGVIMGVVNKMVTALTSGKLIVEGGTGDTRKAIEDWLEKTDATFIPTFRDNVLLDTVLWGTGLAEYVLNEKRDDIAYIAPISPEDIRYKTDQYGRVRVDKEGNPRDFEYDSVTGEVIPLTTDKVLPIKLYGPESDFLGQSPLEAVYRPSVLKLNIEDAIGQSSLRHGFPVYVMKIGDPEHDVTPEQAKLLRKELKDISERTEWIIPYWWDLSIKEGQVLPEMVSIVDYFTNVQLAPFGYPKALLLQTQLGRVGGAIQVLLTNFEEDIAARQATICRQLSRYLFKAVLVTRGVINLASYDPSEIPTCRFQQEISAQKLNKARRISILARVGLITHDPNLEKWLREEEGLPERDPNAPIPPPPGMPGFPPRTGTKPANPPKGREPSDDTGGGEELIKGQRRN